MSEGRPRLRYPELAREGVARLSALEHHLNAESGLDPVLLELVRLRASQLNGCAYCLALHASELRRHHEPESRIAAVAGWRGSGAFTHREEAALRWAEVITDIQDGHAAEVEFEAVRVRFTDSELVELTLAVASINAWNRMAIAFRPQWREPAAAGQTVPGQGAAEAACETSGGIAEANGRGEPEGSTGGDGGKLSLDEDAGL